MSTTVLLVRHGQTESNASDRMSRRDEALNEVGYTQIRRLSSRLAGLPIASIYTSPLKRAYDTATILNEPHQLELKVMEGLAESHLGDWEGLSSAEIKQRWPEEWRQLATDPSDLVMPNGESVRQLTERAIQAFRDVVQSNQGKLVTVVTHAPVIGVLVAHVLGVSNSILPRFQIDSGSLTVIEADEARSQLVTLNDTCHLAKIVRG